MKKYLKKLLCACLAVTVICTLAACRRGGAETTGSVPCETDPAGSTPAASVPENEEVEIWADPVASQPVATVPVQETTEPNGTPGEDDPAEAPTDPARQPTEPGEEENPATETTQPQTGTQVPAALRYEEYLALSPAQQQAYYESFPSLEDFIAWHNTALLAYEANQDVPLVTGPIDIGDYIDP